jgi:hypothetical protein
MSSVYKTHDAQNIITQKIIIGQLSLESLNQQLEISGLIKKYQEAIETVIKEKIKLAEQLHPILMQQFSEFSEFRHQEYTDICGYINELDDPEYPANKEAARLQKSISDLQYKMHGTVKRIMELEATIPQTKRVEQIKAKRKDLLELNGTSCVSEHVNLTDYDLD